MASVINTNTLSMVTQQNLSKSQNDLNTSMERLSSGMRINSAKDDAAGQAIANRMSSQITGLSQAQRNANDGISIAQTAEGGLNQVNDNLQRIRELTVQAQNGTNSASDIDSIQQEVNLRLEEIHRIATETDFNGNNILSESGSGGLSIDIQVGSEDGQKITIDIASNSGWNKFAETDSDSGYVKHENMAEVNGDTRSIDAQGFDVRSVKTDVTIDYATQAAKLDTEAAAANPSINAGEGELISYTNSKGDTDYAYRNDGTTPTQTTIYAVDFDENGIATLGNALGGDDYTLANQPSGSSSINVKTADFDVNISEGALSFLDTAIKTIDDQRSKLGAIQNRFESAITNLQTNETNLSSARSRIEDADYAEEVSSMTTAQILQQAGTSMLTQANQVPQNVLSLLG
ncbi:FliC/FljB family flagellin [Cobetia sp. AM6]|uniref:FliC/FljB family flagellin n=1 Tax=Cobetia sp. AM6 TaxID=2661553 RepID=UPI0012991B85|nr:FliC/FljB family flagellin [Cobetia sp. AM6]BBO56474.1 flagellin [Cobetia sp. AM6]